MDPTRKAGTDFDSLQRFTICRTSLFDHLEDIEDSFSPNIEDVDQ